MASFYLSNSEFNQMQKMVFGEKAKREETDDFLASALSQPKKEEKKQGILGDFVDSVQMGAWQGVSDLSRAVGVTFDSDWFNEMADWAAQGADEQLQTMSPDMQEALGQSALDGAGKGMLNARWWAGNIGAIIGSNLDAVATLGAGKLATTGIKQAGKYLGKQMTKETAEKIGEVAAKQAVKRGLPQKYANVIGLSAVMSAMGAGNRANEAIDEYLSLSDDEVVNHEIFRRAYHDLKNSEEGQGIEHEKLFDMAKERVAHQIGKSAALNPAAVLTDLSVNAVGGLGGGFMGVLDPAKTLKGGLLKGALIEGGTEAMQGGTEQYAINKAAQEHYDPNRDLMQGVQDNVVNSAILGAGFGSPMGGIDAINSRVAANKQQTALENRKVELLQMVNTGNETIDEQIRSYVDMVNRNATELRDLVSASRINALNAMGRKEVRAQEVMLEQPKESAVGFGGDFATNMAVQPTQSSDLQFSANIAPTSRYGVIVGLSDEIDIGNGNYQPFQYEVIEASTLTPTQHKDDNQFRDRDRVASQSQINHIARHLDPRKLTSAPTMEMGAPLLALDGQTIIAGNGRTMAVKQAYQEGGQKLTANICKIMPNVSGLRQNS